MSPSVRLILTKNPQEIVCLSTSTRVQELHDFDRKDTICSVTDLPHFRLVNCRFFAVESNQEIFLDNCIVQKINSLGKVHLLNSCDITEMNAPDVYISDSTSKTP